MKNRNFDKWKVCRSAEVAITFLGQYYARCVVVIKVVNHDLLLVKVLLLEISEAFEIPILSRVVGRVYAFVLQTCLLRPNICFISVMRPIWVNTMLTFDRIKLELLGSWWLPHGCHNRWLDASFHYIQGARVRMS
jgi:hypothetical protein